MADADAIGALQDRIEALEARTRTLEDIHAVRSLQFKYGYYFDVCLYEQLVELFAEDCELKFLNGIYRGKAGARRLYCDWLRGLWTEGRDGPRYGLMYEHLQLQDLIDIAPDGLTAKGRFRGVMMGGWHESMPNPPAVPSQMWEAGVYENQYKKVDGVWRIWRFDYNMLWQADYEKGWAHSEVHLKPLTETYPTDPKGPDELTADTPQAWPHTRIVPFHYPHPVTGQSWPKDHGQGELK